MRFQLLGITRKLGDFIVKVHPECVTNFTSAISRNSLSDHIKEQIEEVLSARQRLKLEKNISKEDLHTKGAAALVVKLEGNPLFSAGHVSGVAAKYSEALSLCPMRSKKESCLI